MRKTTLLWLSLAFACGALLFLTSQKVTDGRQSLALVQYDIQKEEESLRVLQAEWSYLNHPDRLEKLAREYLPVTAMQGRQFVRVGDLGAETAAEMPEKTVAARKEKRIEENLLKEDFSPASFTTAPVKTKTAAKPAAKNMAPKTVAKKEIKKETKPVKTAAQPVAKPAAKAPPKIVNKNAVNRNYVWKPPVTPKLSAAARAPVRGPAVKTPPRAAPAAQAGKNKPVAASPDFNALMKNLGVR